LRKTAERPIWEKGVSRDFWIPEGKHMKKGQGEKEGHLHVRNCQG